jgi:hypothetical protein
LLGCGAEDHISLPVGDDDLDHALDTLSGIAQRGRQVDQRKCVGVDLRRVETLLCHQCHGSACGAAAFAANTVGIDVVLHQMREIHRDRIVWKRREADFPAAINHMNGLVDRHRLQPHRSGSRLQRVRERLPAFQAVTTDPDRPNAQAFIRSGMENAGDDFTPEGWYMNASSRAGCYRK